MKASKKIFFIFSFTLFFIGCMPPPSYYKTHPKSEQALKKTKKSSKKQKSKPKTSSVKIQDLKVDIESLQKSKKGQFFDMNYPVKVAITETFKINSITLICDGDYEIYVGKKLKGELNSGGEYKLGIYSGERVVIAKQKIYDDVIYLKGKTGNETFTLNDKKYRENCYIGVKNNKFYVINELDLEKYLYGVVVREIGSGWPIESIKAQAIIARTYTIKNIRKHEKDGLNFGLCDTVDCQVYGGLSAESETINKAVDETAGQVLTYDGKLANVFYHSTCGGHTENIANVWNTTLEMPYLLGRTCNFCKTCPVFTWEMQIPYDELTRVCTRSGCKVGSIKKVKVRRFTKAGRVKELTLFWNNASTTISGTDLRKMFLPKMKSTKFEIIEKKGGIFIKGFGNGHGVGMCQYGAKGMSEENYSCEAIVKHYFPGTEIRKWTDLEEV